MAKSRTANSKSKNKARRKRSQKERTRDPVSRYMHTLRDCVPISREKEVEVARRAQDGDEEAFEMLVKSNLRLVVKIANEYHSTSSKTLDLVQEGNVGLVKAVNKFDPERGVRLSSYAQYWIRAYILKHLMDSYNLIKIGTTQAQRKLFFNLKKEREKLRQQGIDPTHERIANRMGVKEKTVKEMDIRMSGGEARLDAPIKGSDNLTLGETLRDSAKPATRTVDRVRASLHLKKRLEKFRGTLEGRDAVIWDKRMLADDRTTLRELGEEFGVSRERVRQLEVRIKKNLAEFLQNDADVEFLEALRHGEFVESGDDG